MTHLDRIRIVLMEPSHPGNVGAAARALKNMGLKRLAVVRPVHPLEHPDAVARASGAEDILDRAQVCESLEDALRGCNLVFGASARRRKLEWPELDPRQCARQAVGEAGKGEIALLFGRERSGLTNTELQCCHYLVYIPCDPGFSSLNLAAAVQVLTYELRAAHLDSDPEALPEGADSQDEHELPADTAQMEGLFDHLERVLLQIEFLNPAQPKMLMRRLRRLFNRARLDVRELNILRGILSAVEYRERTRPARSETAHQGSSGTPRADQVE